MTIAKVVEKITVSSLIVNFLATNYLSIWNGLCCYWATENQQHVTFCKWWKCFCSTYWQQFAFRLTKPFPHFLLKFLRYRWHLLVLCPPHQLPKYGRTSLLLPRRERNHNITPGQNLARSCITDFSVSSSDTSVTLRQERDSEQGQAVTKPQ